jgi:uncharacterized membrane protein HdeD (DUF308 family)/predicted flap endonuclease-1-like 5' DNA nuclease
MSSNTRDYPNPGSHWWVVLILGIAAIIMGVLLLTQPLATIQSIVVFLGIYWLITGAVTLVSLLWNREQWGWKLITGIFGIIAGLFIVRNPIISTFVVPAAFGWALGIDGIAIGFSQVVQAFRGGGWGVGILGVFSIILGFLLITNPAIAGFSLAFMLGLVLIIAGIAALFGAFRLRRAGKEYEQAKLDAARSAMVKTTEVPPVMAPGSRAATTVTGVAGATAAGVAGAATAGVAGATAAARQASTGMGQGAAGVAAAAGNVVGEAADVVADAGYAVGDAARGVATATVDVATAAVDAVVDGGNGAVAAIDAALTGNVDPLDAEEMAKFKYPLEFIEGVGEVMAGKLKAAGIYNCLDLIREGCTPKGRAAIAERSGISSRSILTWVNHVDLYRIKGVGSEYADLLEAAGVDTVIELAQRNPVNLTERLSAVNLEKQRVRKVPTQTQVQDWVVQAKGLPRVITY